jgi:predicted alpha/beta superfamily hydrolase
MIRYLFLFLGLMSLTHLKAQQSTATASVSTFTLYAPQYDYNKKIWIYLPKDYNKKNKRYPVIYMPDGQNVFDKATSFSGEWRVDETLDSLQAKAIFVAIEHGGDARITELTPYKNEKYGGGGADVYLDFIMHTVKPHIDSYYRTKKEKEYTGILGSSLGGLTAYYAVISYPDTFGMAGVFSPAFWINPEMFDLNEYSETLDARIYFMAGDSESEDMVPDMDRMAKLATGKAKKADMVYKKTVPGGKHNEALWAKEFAQAFIWLTEEK